MSIEIGVGADIEFNNQELKGNPQYDQINDRSIILKTGEINLTKLLNR